MEEGRPAFRHKGCLKAPPSTISPEVGCYVFVEKIWFSNCFGTCFRYLPAGLHFSSLLLVFEFVSLACTTNLFRHSCSFLAIYHGSSRHYFEVGVVV